jgi:hypothetical protein
MPAFTGFPSFFYGSDGVGFDAKLSSPLSLASFSSLILQSISCADVADVCVKALHDGTARNKSFEVSRQASICAVILGNAIFLGTCKAADGHVNGSPVIPLAPVSIPLT